MVRHRMSVRSFLALPSLVVLAACSSDGALGLSESASLVGGTGTGSNTRASACNGVLGAITVDKVNVPAGASCTLEGTRVRGDVKIARGATLLAVGARVMGNVQAEDAEAVTLRAATDVVGDVQVKRRATVVLEGAQIGGDLQIEEAGASLVATDSEIGGDLQLTKAEGATITRMRVFGDLQLVENRAALVVAESAVRGNLQIEKNAGGVQVDDNQIAQALQCKENTPAPLGGGNIAGEKEEQCRAL